MSSIWKVLKWIAGGSLLALAIGSVFIVVQVNRSPDLTSVSVPPAFPVTEGTINVVFGGTSTLLVGDGQTQWCLDCFFSRPSLTQVAWGKVQPDLARIEETAETAFSKLGSEASLAGVLVAHSHYDHAMDAPSLAKLYGAKVLGSPSTRQIALGHGLSDAQIQVLSPGQTWQAGAFTILAIESAHAPTGFTGGQNEVPLTPPSRATAYKEGISYAFAVWHGDPDHTEPVFLVQPSAGWQAGQFKGLTSDTVFLGVGGLGRQDEAAINAYWQEMVVQTKAKNVFLIHWDDFTRPLLSKKRVNSLVPAPLLIDDHAKTLSVLAPLAERANVQLFQPQAFDRIGLN